MLWVTDERLLRVTATGFNCILSAHPVLLSMLFLYPGSVRILSTAFWNGRFAAGGLKEMMSVGFLNYCFASAWLPWLMMLIPASAIPPRPGTVDDRCFVVPIAHLSFRWLRSLFSASFRISL